MIILKLPESLQRFSVDPVLQLDIQTLADLSPCLKKKNKILHDIIFDSSGQISGFLNLYFDKKLLTDLTGTPTLTGSHELEIVTAFSGG